MYIDIFVHAYGAVGNAPRRGELLSSGRVFEDFVFSYRDLVDEAGGEQLSQHFELYHIINLTLDV